MKPTKLLLTYSLSLLFLAQTPAQTSRPPGFTVALTGEKIELGAHSPHELPGFRFFADGKMNRLRLGVSTRQDVRKIFGEPRGTLRDQSEIYDYDPQWEIQFAFFSATDTRDSRPLRVIAGEYVGKLSGVALIPKTPVSMRDAFFPPVFKNLSLTQRVGSGNIITEIRGADLYNEPYGLQYEIYQKTTLGNQTRRPGDLMSIRYFIPSQISEQFFVVPAGYYETFPKPKN